MTKEAAPVVNSWKIQEWFPSVNAEQNKALKSYYDELCKFNQALNLVSQRTIPTADNVHFADSILASEILFESMGSVSTLADFGSGNGFPGMVIGILKPNVKVSLVDVDTRKCEFLKQAVFRLGLKNVTVLNQQIETLPEGSIEFAIARGLAPLSRALVLTRKVIKHGGVFFHMKSEEWASEIVDIPAQVCAYWKPELLKEYRLPQGEINYAIVKTERISE